VAITPEKQDEATRLATSFLSIQTPINTRLAAVKSETFAGIYVFPQPGHVKPLYMVTEAHFNDDDGLPYDVFVAQATNNKDNIILESFRCDVHLNFVVAVPEGDCPSEATWKNNSGSLFTKADLATWPGLQACFPDGEQKYRFVTLPKCLPIQFGTPEVHRGSIDDACMDIMEENIHGSSFWWGRAIQHWNQEVQSELSTILAADNLCLRGKLKIKKGCLPFAETPFVATTTIYPD
jgi:hypothetical protein